MPRRRFNDGLDELSDDQLKELMFSSGLITPGQDDRLDNRMAMVSALRQARIRSPYASTGGTKESSKNQDMVETPPTGTDDERELADLQETVEAYREDYPDDEIERWTITLESGNQTLIYAPNRAAEDLALDHDIRRVDDLTQLSDDTDLAIYQETLNQPTAERRPAPRLPRRRIGKHEQPAPVADIGAQRGKLPPRSTIPPPGGGEVVHLPRHRRRDG